MGGASSDRSPCTTSGLPRLPWWTGQIAACLVAGLAQGVCNNWSLLAEELEGGRWWVCQVSGGRAGATARPQAWAAATHVCTTASVVFLSLTPHLERLSQHVQYVQRNSANKSGIQLHLQHAKTAAAGRRGGLCSSLLRWRHLVW